MFRKCFDFSGVRLCISAPCELAVTDKLSRFETEREDACVTVRLSFADALPQPHEGDGRRYLYNTARDKNAAPYAAVEGEGADRSILVSEEYRKFTDAVSVLKALDLNHILLERNAVVLHASYIEHEGDAVLFCAPSGTGKSTQAELWKKYRSARIINGDRCLIRKGEAGFTAGGILLRHLGILRKPNAADKGDRPSAQGTGEQHRAGRGHYGVSEHIQGMRPQDGLPRRSGFGGDAHIRACKDRSHGAAVLPAGRGCGLHS